MECTIESPYDYGDGYELRTNYPVARKPHKCGECYKDIIRGEKYEIYYGVYAGTIHCEKTCLDCVSLRKSFFPNGWCFGSIHDEIREKILFELHGEVSAKCILPLTDNAKYQVFELIEESWAD